MCGFNLKRFNLNRVHRCRQTVLFLAQVGEIVINAPGVFPVLGNIVLDLVKPLRVLRRAYDRERCRRRGRPGCRARRASSSARKTALARSASALRPGLA